MSGGGKSTAIRALEDAGFFCIDNLPAVLLPKLLDLVPRGASDEVERLALGIDAPEGRFLEGTPAALGEGRRGVGNPAGGLLLLDGASPPQRVRWPPARP